MKKYLNLLITLLVIVLMISTFYIQKVIANSEAIMLKTTVGDEVELRNVVIDFSMWNRDLYKSVRLEEGDLYVMENLSVLSRLSGAEYSPEIKNLLKNQRSFLRTKDLSNANYFEDERYLAYVGFEYNPEVIIENKGTPNQVEHHYYSYDFVIDILEKDTNKRWSYTVDGPNDFDISFIGIEDVQILGEELKVLAQFYTWETPKHYQWLTFKMANGEISDSKLIMFENESDEGPRLLNDINNLKPEQYYIFSSGPETVDESGNIVPSETLYVFNLKTEQMEEIQIDVEKLGYFVSVEQSNIFFAQREDGLTINAYNIENGTVETMAFPEIKSNDDIIFAQLKRGKLYTAFHDENSNQINICIADVDTGDLIYEGYLKHELQDVEMYISSLKVF